MECKEQRKINKNEGWNTNKTIKSLAQEKREKCKLSTFGRKKNMNSQPKNKEKKSNKTGIMCFPIEEPLFLRNIGYLLSGCVHTLMKIQQARQ